MPARRKDEENLGKYIRIAKDFMNYEFEAIEDYKMLCKVRNITISNDVQKFIQFFTLHSFIGKPKCLIELFNASLELKKQYKNITVANIFEYTQFRFQKYYEILSDGGYLNEQEKDISERNIS